MSANDTMRTVSGWHDLNDSCVCCAVLWQSLTILAGGICMIPCGKSDDPLGCLNACVVLPLCIHSLQCS